MTELDNVFTKGTKALNVGGKLVMLPVNETQVVSGQVAAYNPAISKVTFVKIWDQAASKKLYYAQAVYPAKAGIPTSDEVGVGTFRGFYRVGVGNVNFSSFPTGLQLFDADATIKSSFLLFVRKKVSSGEEPPCSTCSDTITVVCPEKGNKTYVLPHKSTLYTVCGGHTYWLCTWELLISPNDEYNVKSVLVTWPSYLCRWQCTFYRYLQYGETYLGPETPDTVRGNYENTATGKNPDLGNVVVVTSGCQPDGWWS